MKRLTLAQRMAIVLPEDIKGIIVGVLLGDAYKTKLAQFECFIYRLDLSTFPIDYLGRFSVH